MTCERWLTSRSFGWLIGTAEEAWLEGYPTKEEGRGVHAWRWLCYREKVELLKNFNTPIVISH